MICQMPLKVGLTGGIGSGKSVISRMFAMLGVAVYDTDAAAKRLMEADRRVVEAVTVLFGSDVFRDGKLDRAALAGIVFGDNDALKALESIIHPVVNEDFLRWAVDAGSDAGYVIAESAILFESGMNAVMDFTVTVSAPEELRLQRAVKRDGVAAEKIRERMACQITDICRERDADYVLRTDERSLVWPQVLELDKLLRRKAIERENI